LQQNPDKKSDGYNIINGKKKLDVGKIEILKGGRGKSAKKTIGFRVVRNMNNQFNSVTVE
jgi:hypothetical protein